MTEDHAHCEICQRVVAIGERFCDRRECLDQHDKNVKEKKRQVFLLIAILVGVIIITKMPAFAF